MIGKSPLILFSGLGAMTAILLLIFKDPILGLVAGIQLCANDMLRVGDWLGMPQYGADGDVIDISLTTVKVRTWDKTITSIPGYAVIPEFGLRLHQSPTGHDVGRLGETLAGAWRTGAASAR